MKNNVLAVMNKECSRIFNDRKLFFTAVLLPGIMMFVMYSFMGTFIESMFNIGDDYVYQIHAVNMPRSISIKMADPVHRMNVMNISEFDIDDVKQRITDRETDLLVVFPRNFVIDSENFDPATSPIPAPNVQVWSNFARTQSHEAHSRVTRILNDYHHNLTHRFSVNAPSEEVPDGNFNLATEADMFAMIIGMVIPLLFIIFIFTGCQSLAPESIAGEKERGTLGSILVTPVKRRDIAFGKIVGITIFALMSALVSILGALLAMPRMMGLESGNIFEFYSIAELTLLLLVAGSTTLVFVAMLSVLSAYAKSVKEATAYSMPIMFVVIVAGLVGMVFGGIPTEIFFYLIPIVNSSLSISAIFSYDITVVNIITTIVVNIVLTLALTIVLAKIFSSERIVFDK